MKILSQDDLSMISGALNLSNERMSTRVMDLRGTNMGTYIDANNGCFRLGTPSSIMFPRGYNPSPFVSIGGMCFPNGGFIR
jgi:hypothetical protein